jgi:hypothetical protein
VVGMHFPCSRCSDFPDAGSRRGSPGGGSSFLLLKIIELFLI